MNNALFHIIVISVAVYAIIRGFRLRFTGQLASLLGMAFGVVGARVFAPGVEAWLTDFLPAASDHAAGSFIPGVVAASLLYTGLYLLFMPLNHLLRAAMAVIDEGMLDSIFGVFLALVKYMLALSVAYNLLVCCDTSSPLVKLAADDDGNVVEAVMFVAPAMLGCENVGDLFHRQQLYEAKKISYNPTRLPDVIFTRLTAHARRCPQASLEIANYYLEC